MSFPVPILLIVWRRPETTALVIEAIQKVRPSTIYIASDGPRQGVDGEAEKVIATRELVMRSIDWNCDIKTRFSNVNLGCRDGVASAITWFFENVSQGIILEDDVVPHLEFFEYCQLCLEKYRKDSRIWAISGNQTTRDQSVVIKYPPTPLHLRYNFNCWGWATWGDRWKHYSPILSSSWFASNAVTIKSFSGATSGKEILSRARLGSVKKVDTWDYQVNAVAASRLQYTIHPSIALIQNIGFGQDATHTFGKLNRDYFYEVNGLSRDEWILSVRDFLKIPNCLPPFIREVSDLAYLKPTPLVRFKSYCKKLLKYIQVF